MKMRKFLLATVFVLGPCISLAQVSGGPSSGGGTSGSITTPGTSGTVAQAVQGITGGVPLPVSGTISATLGTFVPSANTVSLSVSTTSSSILFGSSGNTVVVTNAGANAVYFAIGTSGVTTTTSTGQILPAGGVIAVGVGTNNYIAAITASGSSLIFITPGNGLPAIALASTGNTVAPTSAGTSATTANPVQGVTNGVPLPISGTVTVVGSASTRITGLIPAVLAGANTYINTTAGCTGTETFTLVGGTYTTAATMAINSINGSGTITGIRLLQGGSYSVEPTSPGIPVTFSSGSTCTGTLTLQSTGYNAGVVTLSPAPVHGWKVNSPTAVDLWVTDDGTTPSVAGNTSLRAPYNGGQYATEPGELPVGSALQITAGSALIPFIASVW